MKVKRLVCLLVLVLSMNGCVTVTPLIHKEFESSRTFQSTYNEVWQAAVKSATSTGDAILAAEKEGGLISFDRRVSLNIRPKADLALIPKNRYCWNPHISVNLILKELNPEKVSVSVKVRITATCGGNLGFTFPALADLGSSGELEKEYLDKIQDFLIGDKSPKDSK
ncbi:MAG: hypothetical protein PHC29_05115 [Candidatus Omnitrophica bacterium]|nr:hypothetical protein [Candidatus Omnitrophota bacterium]